jgi:hypothetical protein
LSLPKRLISLPEMQHNMTPQAVTSDCLCNTCVNLITEQRHIVRYWPPPLPTLHFRFIGKHACPCRKLLKKKSTPCFQACTQKTPMLVTDCCVTSRNLRGPFISPLHSVLCHHLLASNRGAVFLSSFLILLFPPHRLPGTQQNCTPHSSLLTTGQERTVSIRLLLATTFPPRPTPGRYTGFSWFSLMYCKHVCMGEYYSSDGQLRQR